MISYQQNEQKQLKPSRSSHLNVSHQGVMQPSKQSLLRFKPNGDNDGCDDPLSIQEDFMDVGDSHHLIHAQHDQEQLDTSPKREGYENSVQQQQRQQHQLRNQRSNHSQSSYDMSRIMNSSNAGICQTSGSLFRKSSTERIRKHNLDELSQQYLEQTYNLSHYPYQQNYSNQFSTDKSIQLKHRTVSKEHQQEYSQKLYEQDSVYKSRRQRLTDDHARKQMDECTFNPKVNDNGKKRSVGQFSEQQRQFQIYVEEKTQMVREQIEEVRMSNVMDKPKILTKSKQMMESKRKSEVPAFERLYHLHQRREDNVDGTVPNGKGIHDQQGDENRYYKNKDTYEMMRQQNLEREAKENTFRPIIQKKSKSLVRGEKIDDILYRDAQRRLEKQKRIGQEERQSSHTNQPKLSLQSELLLIQKFKKEFYALVLQLEKNQGRSQDKVDQLDLSNVFEILIRHGFIKYNNNSEQPIIENEKKLVFLLWSLIGGDTQGFAKADNLLIFLLSVLRLGLQRNDYVKKPTEGPPNVHHPLLQKTSQINTISENQKEHNESQKERIEMQIDLGYFNNGLWILGEDDKQVIHKAFEVLYRNRLVYEELGNKSKEWEYSFQPQISQTSAHLANQHREKVLAEAVGLLGSQQIKMRIPSDGKISHQQLLLLQSLASQHSLHALKQQIDQEELKECSFQPQISTYIRPSANKLATNISSNTKTEPDVKKNESLSIDRGNRKSKELFYQANPKLHRRDKSALEVDYEKSSEQCTFQPEITVIPLK